jgi:hypothetical protein
MTTTDNLLLKITDNTVTPVEEYMSPKDARLARSLASAVNLPIFLTENQAKLTIKLLTQYSKKISLIESDIETILKHPTWSKEFRVVEQIRKIYLRNNPNGENAIFIEFTFSSSIRKTLSAMSKHVQGGVQPLSTKVVWVDLTEKNIVIVVDTFKLLKFDIDQKIQDFYQIIKKWEVTHDCQKLFYGDNLMPSIKNSLETEIDPKLDNANNLIIDRSNRYQYIVKKTEKNQENLEDYISHRTTSKVWVDSNIHSLSDVIVSLTKLNRLPLLVVFDSWSEEVCFKNLQNLSNSLDVNGINDNVGIYFRLPSAGVGIDFNALIGSKKYNSKLDSTTSVACIQTSKLPKFFLKDCSWAPKSVIVLSNNLRHSKTAVYTNRCDLIVSYADKPSLFDSQTGWATNTWAL